MLAKNTAQKIEALIAPTVAQLGFELARVAVTGPAGNPTLQIMAEHLPSPEGTRSAMKVEDCETISRALSDLLDAEDPLPGEYELEVSSPGIDRPLTKPAHFARFIGHTASVELDLPDATTGRKRFQGDIAHASDETISVIIDGQTHDIPFASIAKAKLVLTDKLIAAKISN